MFMPRLRKACSQDGWASIEPASVFVAGNFLVRVAMGEIEHGLPGSPAVFGAQVVIDGHVLQGFGRGVVEREVELVVVGFGLAALPDFVRDAVRAVGLFAIGLADADGKSLVRIFPVVHEAEIGFDFAGEEELVGGRQERERTAVLFDDCEAVAGS